MQVNLPPDLSEQLQAFIAAADDRVAGFKAGIDHSKALLAQHLVLIAKERAAQEAAAKASNSENTPEPAAPKEE